MAFNKKIWKDRVAEFINRRLLTKEDGSTDLVTVARSEGTISVEGDAFNAETMNDLEDRVEAAFNELNTNLKNAIIVKTYTKRLELAANEYFAVRVTAPVIDGYKCIASCYCSQINGNNTKSYIYFSDYSEKNNNLAIENLLSQKNVSEHKIVFIYTNS